MKKYNSYKDSGIEWIGNIPKHWLINPLFSICKKNIHKNTKKENNDVFSLSYGKIVKRDVSTNFGLLPESFDTYQVIESGYIVLRLTDLQNDKNSLRVGLAKEKGIITSAYIGLIFDKEIIDANFIYYQLHNYDLYKVFYNFGNGVRQMMTFSDLKHLPISFPAIQEQTAIANYLDHKTAQIDALISKKEKLIELLNEERTALINQAVTKGLNPDAPMKDSGIEWIGEVPEHWEIKKLKYISRIKTGYTPLTSENENFSDEGIVWVKPDNLNGFVPIIDSKDRITESGLKSQNIIPKNSVLLCCIGSIGKFGVAGIDLVTNQQINSITFNDLLDPEYGKYLISCAENEFIVNSNGNVVRILNTFSLGNILFSVPPLDEQRKIGLFVARKIKEFEYTNSVLVKEIDLLKEYRTALISEVVTGKVDVRDEKVF